MIALTALVGALLGTLSFLGVRVSGAGELAPRVARHDTAIAVQNLRIDALEKGQATQVYINCQVLARVSPRGAILPKECTNREP